MSDFKRRWRAVRNATYDTALADRAAQWSDENIFERLGIKVPKQVPKLKPMPRLGTKKRQTLMTNAQRRIRKHQLAILAGLTPERAYTYRYATFERIENIDASPPPPNIGGDDAVGVTPSTKEMRIDEWSNWAKKGNDYPDWVYEAVEFANSSQGLGINASYGWAMVYYAYRDNKDLDVIMSMYVVDPFDGDKYIEVIRT